MLSLGRENKNVVIESAFSKRATGTLQVGYSTENYWKPFRLHRDPASGTNFIEGRV